MGADGEITAEERIEQIARPREPMMKAYSIGIDKADQMSADTAPNTSSIALQSVDILEPPYDPGHLVRLFEHSSSLRQNIDAYKTNIDGFGHVFDPILELKEAGARDLVSDALFLERGAAAQSGLEGALAQVSLAPTDAEIDAKIESIRYAMRLEKAQIESFFDNCVAEESFTSLRRKSREDLEVTGNGYWEVIRNEANLITQFCYMPSRSVRVSQKKSEKVSVPQQVRVGLLAFKTETYKRRFRRYVQLGEPAVFFKEFGDPSFVSSRTGNSYPTLEALQATERDVEPANEVFHFKIHSLKNGAYGVPRWIGNLLSVLGSRSAEEVNLAYFDNKAIPPIAILVSGGRLGDESVKRIQDFVETQIKGKKNFHKILVIEAETTVGSIGLGDNAGKMRVEIKQLTDAQLKDGLFLAYDSANMDKVGMGFRLPRLLRGDIRDFNRASAEAALDFAESQVFVPERNDFDFAMNRFILPLLGIRYWRFKSNGPRLSDSQTWGDMITKLTLAGILTPADARELAGKKVLSHELPVIKADWTNQPLALTIAGVGADTALDGVIPGLAVAPDGGGVTPDPNLIEAAKSRVVRTAKQLLKLRDAFRKQEGEEAVARFKADRIEDGEVVFKFTEAEMKEHFGVTKS